MMKLVYPFPIPEIGPFNNGRVAESRKLLCWSCPRRGDMYFDGSMMNEHWVSTHLRITMTQVCHRCSPCCPDTAELAVHVRDWHGEAHGVALLSSLGRRPPQGTSTHDDSPIVNSDEEEKGEESDRSPPDITPAAVPADDTATRPILSSSSGDNTDHSNSNDSAISLSYHSSSKQDNNFTEEHDDGYESEFVYF